MAKRTRGALIGFGVMAVVVAIVGCQALQPGPTAEFTVFPVVLYAGETFALDASASLAPASIVSYRWTLSDGQVLAGQRVNASLALPGTYDVVLRVQDVNGRTDETQGTVVVYSRSGTVILEETFSDGDRALARWILDPTWAAAGDARIDFVAGPPGHALYIRSAATRWHRRYRSVELPPLRVGQKVVFSIRIMTLRNQDFHTFLFSPARVAVDSLAGSLPFFRFSNEGRGSYVHTPTSLGTDIALPVEHMPDVYRWYTYTFVFDQQAYQFLVNDELLMSGPLSAPFHDTSRWVIVLGDESLTETCNAYFDDILVTIQE